MSEKLQKVLARQGVDSRRKIEELIKQNRIKVDGEIAEIGMRVNEDARIEIDGKLIKLNQAKTKPRLLIYHKPLGEVCTRSDEKGRTSVFSKLPKLTTGRWVMVGRLDINSSGLLLFTTDGELANKLMHPSSGFEKEYLVRVCGNVTPKIIQELRRGVELDDGPAKFKSIKPHNRQQQARIRVKTNDATNQWYKVVVTEGRNRIVRRLWEAKKITVNRLIRVRFCDIVLPAFLKPGDFMEVEGDRYGCCHS